MERTSMNEKKPSGNGWPGKEPLFGKTLRQLEEIRDRLGLPSYTPKQVARWLYRGHLQQIAAMTDLSKEVRHILEGRFTPGTAAPTHVSESSDGTKKYLFPPGIESAFIPEEDRATLCLSTQIGCKMGCRFCWTGKQGFQGNLSPGEILNQYESLPERERITNFVYMGMGEPLDNLDAVLDSLTILTAPWGYGFSPSRITVSTVGILPGIKRFLEESHCHLAVSLHSPFDEERSLLMPIQHRYPVKEVLEVIRSFDIPKQRRVSFEYIVFEGLNHSPRHVKELARILQGIRCRINLIRFHSGREQMLLPDGRVLTPASNEQVLEFQEQLNRKGIRTTIRKSRGQDIEAACGQLSTKKRNSVLP
ncbi:MAG: 23S rRNA (adenine(2503)-C(2))-methyltransferase RlmN [Spirochaetales bacterium]